MGKKRSRDSDDYDIILRKVKKLESKLRKRRRISSASTESDGSYRRFYDTHERENYEELLGEDEIDDVYEDSQPELVEQVAGPSLSLPNSEANATSLPMSVPEAQPGPSTFNTDNAQPGPSTTNAKNVHDDNILSLDPEILQLLGEDPANQKIYGETLHKDVASRWAHILTNGLNKDIQLDLMKRYLPPENCPNIRAPKLNLEIRAALTDMNIKKDLYSQSKQNQLASSLAAIGRVLNWALSSNNIVPQDVIKSLSDAGRLICDSHYKESQSRRYAALSTLNKNVRDTVKNTSIDDNLFGSALTDHIKSSKAINRTGSEIKQRPTRPAYRSSATQSQPRVALNSRGAPQRLASAVEPRTTPASRRPPRDRRLDSSRGRRPTNNARGQMRRR
ncbi:hypothetical protein ACJJTC_012522 [Scirpophaga incertulas]